MKLLSALPSQSSFSLQLFIESWNHSNKSPRIDPGFADIPSLAEGLVSNLQIKQYANRPPVLTQFLASFKCNKCGLDHVKVKNWEFQVQALIPLLQLPQTSQSANVLQLLNDHIQETFQTRCGNLACRNRIFDARLEVELGHFTIIAVNRFVDPRAKLMTKLELTRPDQLILDPGKLVSVVCHRGDINRGHFVSYHSIGDQWFLNNDSRQCSPSGNPLHSSIGSETVELLFFKTE